eukprot:8487690-Karenia_brevis.AAC.1
MEASKQATKTAGVWIGSRIISKLFSIGGEINYEPVTEPLVSTTQIISFMPAVIKSMSVQTILTMARPLSGVLLQWIVGALLG